MLTRIQCGRGCLKCPPLKAGEHPGGDHHHTVSKYIGILYKGSLNKNGKSWEFGPTRRGLAESQVFIIKIYQTTFFWVNGKKCDETHNT